MTLGEAGHSIQWGPGLQPEVGHHYDIVFDLTSASEYTGSVALLFPSLKPVRIVGLCDAGVIGCNFSALKARFDGVIGGLCQYSVDVTKLMKHEVCNVEHLFRVLEVCCGAGFTTEGLHAAGFVTDLAVDLNELFTNMFHARHQTVTITGDINSDDVLRMIHRTAPDCKVLAAGVSCHDIRSSALVGILRTLFVLRIPVAILECVCEAQGHAWVSQTLHGFAKHFHYHMQDCQLSLQNAWPCCRDRWWVVLSAFSLGPISLAQMPKLPFPDQVKQVIPRPLTLPDDELQQLELSVDEYRLFLRFSSPASHVLPLHGVAPAMSHSCGSQVLACPCGCRPPFDESILARGIFGYLFPVEGVIDIDGTLLPRMRHPHPTEATLINGCIPNHMWPGSLRLWLSAIGQLAAPFHALWVAGQVRVHIEKLHMGDSSFDLSNAMSLHAQKLLEISHQLFATPAVPALSLNDVECDDVPCPCGFGVVSSFVPLVHLGDPASFTLVDRDFGTTQVIRLDSSDLACHHLLAAESRICPARCPLEFHDGQTGEPCSLDVKLAGKVICVSYVHHSPLEFAIDDASFGVDHHMDAAELGSVGVVSTALVPLQESGRPDLDTCEVSRTIPFAVPCPLPEISAVGGHEVGHNESLVAHSVPLLAPAVAVAPLSEEQLLDPLGALSASQLMEVLGPKINSIPFLDSIRSQLMVTAGRLQILDKQGSVMADDEVHFHVKRMIEASGRTDIAFLDPLLATEGTRRPVAKMIQEWFDGQRGSLKAIASAVWVDKHWVPFFWTWTSGRLLASSWDVVRDSCTPLALLHSAVAKVVGVESFIVQVTHRNFAPAEFCGIAAVRFLDSMIRGKMLPTQLDECKVLHQVAREIFVKEITAFEHVPRPWAWANGLEPHAHARLLDLLVQHGVPPEQCDGRISLIIQALGLAEVQKVLTSASPWRGLKSLANQNRPVFQLVLPAELEAAIQVKQNKKSRTAAPKQVGPKSVPAKPVMLDPAKLAFEKGLFVSESNQPLKQLQVSQLGPFAEGVAICNRPMIEQFLKTNQKVSQQCLAVFIVHVDDLPDVVTLCWSQIRIPLRCVTNGEPLLVSGVLLQLGGKLVVKASAEKIVDPAVAAAACVKIAVYRDSVLGSWQDVVHSPIKYILQHVVCLNTCRQSDCVKTCGMWHVPDDSDVSDVIFDLWRRQWVSMGFKPCDPSKAEVFLVNIRYAKSVELLMLKSSGVAGIFLEPRSLDAKQPNLDFQVVWLPRATPAEVQHAAQCTASVIGIVRMGSRFGVRVATCDMAAVSSILRPGTVVLAAGPRVEFEMGPLPFGMDRSSVHALCASIKWKAKPVSPLRTVSGSGVVWLMHAADDPVDNIVTAKFGDVVISKLPLKTSKHVPNALIASSATMKLCVADDMGNCGDDPWLVADPWQAPIAKLSVPAPVLPSADHLREAEARIESAILQKLQPQVPMETDEAEKRVDQLAHDTDVRLQFLENQVQQLLHRQGNVETQITEQDRRHDAQLSQFQCQVSAQMEAQTNQMQSMFSQQMTKIEALLEKKARHE